MSLLDVLRRLICGEDGAASAARDEKTARRGDEISQAEKRLERMLVAEEDMFKRGRDHGSR